MTEKNVMPAEESISKVELLSSNLGFGPLPSADAEAAQRITLAAHGKVRISRYRYGNGGRHVRTASQGKRIDARLTSGVIRPLHEAVTLKEPSPEVDHSLSKKHIQGGIGGRSSAKLMVVPLRSQALACVTPSALTPPSAFIAHRARRIPAPLMTIRPSDMCGDGACRRRRRMKAGGSPLNQGALKRASRAQRATMVKCEVVADGRSPSQRKT